MIYPSNFEQKTGFDRIRSQIKERCMSALGYRETDRMQFSTKAENILHLCTTVIEMMHIVQEEDQFPYDYYFDLSIALEKIRIDGTVIDLQEAFDLKRSLTTLKSLITFFKNREQYQELKKRTSAILLPTEVLQNLNLILTPEGDLKDNATKELAQLRSELREKQNTVNRRMQQIMRQARADSIVAADCEPAMRNGRLVIPVEATYKRRINGYVHDESATGKTVFIEPAEVVELNNQLNELEHAERREIIKILRNLASIIRPFLSDLQNAFQYLGFIDFTIAKARFCIEIGCCLPLCESKPLIIWKQARHPLLYISLKKENKKIVPLDIYLDEKDRMLIISGPNAGGKSVCLQTAGLVQYMFQCGMPVPMDEGSTLGIFEQLFINIGDEQSIENDLSTYSSHLVNMKFFLRQANENTLILIDEFGAGTEPMLGGAIAEAVLENLNQKKAFGVITTHYTNLKHIAASTEGICNGAMLYDTGKLQPLFVLEMGKPGSSFAFEIARKIGLPEEILKRASEKIGQEHIDYDKSLKDIARDKVYYENKRRDIKEEEKRFEEVIKRYIDELEHLQTQRKVIIKEAKDQATSLLKEANRRIENTIREIRENGAEKEKTRLSRSSLDNFKEIITTHIDGDDDRLNQKIDLLHKKEKSLNPKSTDMKQETSSDNLLKAGDKVRLIGQDSAGTVKEIKGKHATIEFGSISTRITIDKVEKISDRDYFHSMKSEVPSNYQASTELGERRLFFKPEIDLRGMRSEEALDEVRRYIDDAVMIGCSKLRILHGKGDGILKQMIRKYLRTEKVVKSCRDEVEQLGGAGITLVDLDI